MNSQILIVVAIALAIGAILYLKKEGFGGHGGGGHGGGGHHGGWGGHGGRWGGRGWGGWGGRRGWGGWGGYGWPYYYGGYGYGWPSWWYDPLYYTSVVTVGNDTDSCMNTCLINYKKSIDVGVSKKDAEDKLTQCVKSC